MKIVVSGASGFIGRSIVPLLSKQVGEIILVGRDIVRLKALFPNHTCTDYETVSVHIKNIDAVVHLAALVSTSNEDVAAFEKANVEFLSRVARLAVDANIPVFINAATFGMHDNHYSRTKKLGELALTKFRALKVVTLRLPGVYGDSYNGRLEFLNRVPKLFRRQLFWIVASLRPTVSIERVSNAVLKYCSSKETLEVVVTDRQIGNWVFNFVKRVVDLTFAVSVVIFLWWLLIMVWVAVRLSSAGPGIFSQERVGKNGTKFTCYKFRTMATGTKQAGTHDIDAASITNIGKFLRKTKIDELPQIWNIFRNEMSLVGPRPCLPMQKELVEARKNLGVLEAKPGISGWAQIHGIYMADPMKLAIFDDIYLNTRSLILDVKIILMTVLGKGQGDKFT